MRLHSWGLRRTWFNAFWLLGWLLTVGIGWDHWAGSNPVLVLAGLIAWPAIAAHYLLAGLVP